MTSGRLRLRTLLAILVLSTVLPLGLFAGWLSTRVWEQQRATVDRQNVETARAISVAVDQEVQSGRSALQVLAMFDDFDPPVPSVLNEQTLRLMSRQPGWYALVLADRQGRIVFDTEARKDEPVQIGESEWIHTVVATGRSAVSNLFHDTTAGGYFFMIAVPVVRANEVRYVLAAKVRSSSLSEVLRRQSVAPGGVVVLMDQAPRIMARTRGEAQYVGQQPRAKFLEMRTRMSEGSWRGNLMEGTPVYSSMSRSPITGWTVGIGQPVEAVDAPIRRSIWALTVAGMVFLAGGLGLALILGQVLTESLGGATAAARGLSRGELITMAPSHIVEANELAHALSEAVAILETRQHERDQALLAEYAARREAETLSRSKDEFVATMSHELRTPLNAIFGWVRLLRTGNLDERRREHALEVIERNTRAQARLIEDLLDMSRIVTGKLRLEVRRVDLATVLQSALEGVRPTATAKEIAIGLQATPATVMISGDPARLQQIVWNLLSNSVKFTSKGGRIDVTLDVEGSDAVIRVVDSGSGIAPELLPHIFERFRQGSSSASRVHGGLGIGLALVRHLVEMHGGTVVAASDGEGRGASFTVRIPVLGQRTGQVSEAAPAGSNPRPSSEASVLEGIHVLVVDDDADARDLIRTTLQHAGAQVTPVSSMQDAMTTLHSALPDIVVSDVAMPHGTGYDFLRHLRRTPQTAKIPAIALTAYVRAEDRDDALAAGFNVHLSKPMDPQELVRVVAAEVGRTLS